MAPKPHGTPSTGSDKPTASEVACDDPGMAGTARSTPEPGSGNDDNTVAVGSPTSSRAELPPWVLNRALDPRTKPARVEIDPFEGSEDFLTVTEAAIALRISSRTLRRQLADGKVPHIRVGRQIRIPRAILTAGW
jgi:excisionase family DNA binding protein